MDNNIKRLYELDLLRFIAAMSVVLYHYMFRGQYGNFMPVHFESMENVAKYGHLGVNLFFMISGFVISLSAENRNAKQFVISRVVRLYPAFWVGVTFTSIMIYFFGEGLFQVNLSQYFVNLTMLAQFVGVEDIDGVYWTLYVELKFYAIIFLILFFDKFNRIEWLLNAWIAILLLNIVLPVPNVVSIILFPEWAPYFIGGTLFYLIKAKGLSLLRINAMLFSFSLSIYEALKGIDEMKSSDVFDANYIVTFSEQITVMWIVLFYLVFTLIIFNKLSWFRSQYAVTIGALTYPLYLIHENIGYIVFTHFNGVINKYSLLFVIVISMLVLSWLINVLIEKRLGLFLKKWLNIVLVSKDTFIKSKKEYIN